jgi:hypothetical protein
MQFTASVFQQVTPLKSPPPNKQSVRKTAPFKMLRTIRNPLPLKMAGEPLKCFSVCKREMQAGMLSDPAFKAEQ